MKAVKERYITNNNGKKTEVIIPIKQYQELLEDLNDLGKVAERREEKSISLEEMKQRLKKDGRL